MAREQMALLPYQERLIQHINDNRYCAIWADMGSRKTATTLLALLRAYWSCDVNKVLVVAPRLVAESVWSGEIDRWAPFEPLTYRIFRTEEFQLRQVVRKVKRKGREEEVKELLPTAPRRGFESEEIIHIVAKDNLAHLVRLHTLSTWPYDTMILDESSAYRKATSVKWKVVKALRKFGALNRLIQLSGTPRPKSLLDLWSPMYLLDKGERLGKSFVHFRETYFNPGQIGFSSDRQQRVFSWEPKPGAEAEIFKRVEDLCISLSPGDLAQLPPLTVIPKVVRLPEKANELYQRMRRGGAVTINGVTIVAANRGVRVGCLVQLASGAMYEDGVKWHKTHDEKLDALEEVVEEADGRPVLVACWYKHERERIRKRFPQAQEPEDLGSAMVEKWNSGQVPMLILHPDKGSHGLNLQGNDGVGVWFGPVHNLEFTLQWNKRMHRPGRATPVTIYVIVAAGTVDEVVMLESERRRQAQDRLLEHVSMDSRDRREAELLREGQLWIDEAIARHLDESPD
jgi:SNF2 family DNA or RNA helicase